MTVLAFDTGTDILGICLRVDEKYYTYTAKAGLRHSETLLAQIDHLYESSGTDKKSTDLIVCAKGPGSFTGLRIGMSIAKGLSDGWGIPMVSVPSLDILAYGYDYFDGAVMPVLDAKSGKVFTAVYRNGKRETDFLDIGKNELPALFAEYGRILLTGSYAPAVMELFGNEADLRTASDWNDCRIHSCVKLGEMLHAQGISDAENSGPIYIRPSEAELSRNG